MLPLMGNASAIHPPPYRAAHSDRPGEAFKKTAAVLAIARIISILPWQVRFIDSVRTGRLQWKRQCFPRRRNVVERDRRSEDAWFQENEKQLLETARLAREKREAERAAKAQTEERQKLKDLHFMKCPKCGHDMKEENLEGVSVDRCSFCEGIYLDAGELDQIFLKKEEDRKGFFRKLVKI
jgi:hypothetical protein